MTGVIADILRITAGTRGGACNPAVAVGLTVMDLSTWANIWMYLVACPAGAIAAALLFTLLYPDDT